MARRFMTLQPKGFLDALRKTDRHSTADAIDSWVRRRLPKISPGAVYRNLEILAPNANVSWLCQNGPSRQYGGRLGVHVASEGGLAVPKLWLSARC
jgi:Fe2+ or Zn2+ uptake regulation protein